MCGGLNRHRRAVVIDDKCPLWVTYGHWERLGLFRFVPAADMVD